MKVWRPVASPPLLALLIALVVTSTGWRLASSHLFRLLEARSLDLRFQVRGTLPADPNVLIVRVDDATFRSLRLRYPFPPLVWADLIRKLRAGGAAVIAFDLLYSEPTRECDPPRQDELLAEVIRESGGIVWGSGLEDGRIPVPPIPVIRDAVARTGFLNLPDETDSRIRRFRTSAFGVPSFAAAVVDQYAGFLPAPWRSSELHWIGYRGPAGSFPWVSMSDVLAGKVAAERLRGRICLVGASFTGSHDTYPTPFHGLARADMDGVEIHANIVGSILAGEPFRTVPAAPVWILVGALSLGLAVLPLSGRSWAALVLWLVSIAGWAGAALALFLRGRLVLLVGPVAVLSGSFWLAVFTLTLLERKRRREIRSLFAAYVDPSVVSWLIRNPDRANLDGERRVVTVLDTDIEGFTAITEATDPADLVKQLNRYFEALTDSALAEGGMLDKYVGDALMVVFGFPREQPDHAERALRAAERICVRVDALNAEWSAAHRPVFKTRIGICSGEVIIGSVGGAARKAVTAMGDAANLASRIEALNKQFGTRVLLAESTARLLPPSLPLRDVGEVEIRGYQKLVHLYAPAFDAGSVRPRPTP